MVAKTYTNSNKYYELKENKILWCMDNLYITGDFFGTFAMVPTSEAMTTGVDVFTNYYSVAICEPAAGRPYAERCTCQGNREHGHICIHMIAVDRMFAKTDMSKSSRPGPIDPAPTAGMQAEMISWFLATIVAARLALKDAPKQLPRKPARPERGQPAAEEIASQPEKSKRAKREKKSQPAEATPRPEGKTHPLVSRFAAELKKMKGGG